MPVFFLRVSSDHFLQTGPLVVCAPAGPPPPPIRSQGEGHIHNYARNGKSPSRDYPFVVVVKNQKTIGPIGGRNRFPAHCRDHVIRRLILRPSPPSEKGAFVQKRLYRCSDQPPPLGVLDYRHFLPLPSGTSDPAGRIPNNFVFDFYFHHRDGPRRNTGNKGPNI